MRKSVELGCYFSINGAMIKSKRFLDMLPLIPSNRILLETDSPFTCFRSQILHTFLILRELIWITFSLCYILNLTLFAEFFSEAFIYLFRYLFYFIQAIKLSDLPNFFFSSFPLRPNFGTITSLYMITNYKHFFNPPALH